MSGVFSIASHCALQYFSDVLHVHNGCAHFLVSAMFHLLKLCSRELSVRRTLAQHDSKLTNVRASITQERARTGNQAKTLRPDVAKRRSCVLALLHAPGNSAPFFLRAYCDPTGVDALGSTFRGIPLGIG
jgi:hypothetical protein